MILPCWFQSEVVVDSAVGEDDSTTEIRELRVVRLLKSPPLVRLRIKLQDKWREGNREGRRGGDSLRDEEIRRRCISQLPIVHPISTKPAIHPRLEIARIEHKGRKSTRLNSSHRTISYAVFCLKKKTQIY